MVTKTMKQILQVMTLATLVLIVASLPAVAQEVGKGKIPQDQLQSSYKKLDWGSPIWDVDEALAALKKAEGTLWVDTRPESFFKKGTVRDAVLLVYNKKGMPENTLSAEAIEAALSKAGLSKDTAKIVLFCQGPKCHRSYNATFAAVTEWGYNPDNIVWFRAGYPLLFKKIQGDAKLKRKAKRYVSDKGVDQL